MSIKIAKKPKLKSVSFYKTKLWELVKQVVRLKYGNTCYTCGKTGLEGSNWHTAHFIPSSTCGAFLRYDLRNLRPCCYNCNINLGGNGAIYYRNMVQEIGQKKVDKIFQDKNIIIKADVIWYVQKIEEYKSILGSLETDERTRGIFGSIKSGKNQE